MTTSSRATATGMNDADTSADVSVGQLGSRADRVDGAMGVEPGALIAEDRRSVLRRGWSGGSR